MVSQDEVEAQLKILKERLKEIAQKLDDDTIQDNRTLYRRHFNREREQVVNKIRALRWVLGQAETLHTYNI